MYSLALQASDKAVLEVLREERKEYCETNEANSSCEKDSEPVEKALEVRVGIDLLLILTFIFQNKVEEMECDPPAQEAKDSDSDFEMENTTEKKIEKEVIVEKEPVRCNSPESNKENVSNEELEVPEEQVKEAPIKVPAMNPPRDLGRDLPKPKSPFTSLNSKQQQKKPVTPGGSSRGAMLLNLSRKVSSLDTNSLPSPTPPPPIQASLSMVSVSPMRPWVKYAPSPSHASPSASILKRPADDLDSSTEVSFLLK